MIVAHHERAEAASLAAQAAVWLAVDGHTAWMPPEDAEALGLERLAADRHASEATMVLSLGGERYVFAAGETLHTENSHKYSVAGFQQQAALAGFAAGPVWTDARAWFALLWLQAPA